MLRRGAQGQKVFPEFAWTLENNLIVRENKEINPSEDYIDGDTAEVKMYLAFFSPETEVGIGRLRLRIPMEMEMEMCYNASALCLRAALRGRPAGAVAS